VRNTIPALRESTLRVDMESAKIINGVPIHTDVDMNAESNTRTVRVSSIASYHTMSYHIIIIISHDITLYRITSYDITLHHSA
jgi:hypothetical protein